MYTSQGCNSCPSANEFLGELAKLGYGPDEIVPVAFHVDYFNEPWVDPFSHKDYSRRELAYNSVLQRKDLYFTPMMMVDGRYPLLGSNRPEAIKAIKKAIAEKPGASLKLALAGKDAERTLTVDLAAQSTEIVGRQLMVGVSLTEGPISTRVPSGENAGKTLVEPFVVRSFVYKTAKFAAEESTSLTFPIKLHADAVAAKCQVSAFVQDWDNGKVYQADSIPWAAEETAARYRVEGSAPRRVGPSFQDLGIFVAGKEHGRDVDARVFQLATHPESHVGLARGSPEDIAQQASDEAGHVAPPGIEVLLRRVVLQGRSILLEPAIGQADLGVLQGLEPFHVGGRGQADSHIVGQALGQCAMGEGCQDHVRDDQWREPGGSSIQADPDQGGQPGDRHQNQARQVDQAEDRGRQQRPRRSAFRDLEADRPEE